MHGKPSHLLLSKLDNASLRYAEHYSGCYGCFRSTPRILPVYLDDIPNEYTDKQYKMERETDRLVRNFRFACAREPPRCKEEKTNQESSVSLTSA